MHVPQDSMWRRILKFFWFSDWTKHGPSQQLQTRCSPTHGLAPFWRQPAWTVARKYEHSVSTPTRGRSGHVSPEFRPLSPGLDARWVAIGDRRRAAGFHCRQQLTCVGAWTVVQVLSGLVAAHCMLQYTCNPSSPTGWQCSLSHLLAVASVWSQ